MKGLVIFAVVVAAIGASLWLLFRPSDRDLRRLEAETRASIDALQERLNDAASSLNRLRATRPNVGQLDQQLADFRRKKEQLEQELAREAAESPDPSIERASFIDARRKAATQAEAERAAADDFVKKIGVLEGFVRDALPRLQVMLLQSQQLVATRDSIVARKVALDEALRVKVDALVARATSARNLAAQVLDVGADDSARVKTIAQTARSDIERIVAEQQELARELAKL